MDREDTLTFPLLMTQTCQTALTTGEQFSYKESGYHRPVRAFGVTEADRLRSRFLDYWKHNEARFEALLWNRVDVLINNVASFHHKRGEEAVRADWDKVLSVNVADTSFCSKHAVEAMKRTDGSAIVDVASINGLTAMPNWLTYNASKAAVVEMSKSMAMDLGPFNIPVNCVCPGVTDTPALRRAIAELGASADDVIKGYIEPNCFIKRFGLPEEVAPAILHLASTARWRREKRWNSRHLTARASCGTSTSASSAGGIISATWCCARTGMAAKRRASRCRSAISSGSVTSVRVSTVR